MAGMMESFATINSIIRTLLACALLGGLSTAAWFGYSAYSQGDRERAQTEAELLRIQDELGTAKQQIAQRDRRLADQEAQISQLEVEVQEQQEEIQRLDTSLRLLKVNHRIAHLRVLEQYEEEQTDRLMSVIEFVEVNDEGHPIDEPRQFEIIGDIVYVDNWVVKFDDKYVEQADIDRSTSITLFRRIFGEYQEPSEGFELDQRGTRPTAYGRGGQMSDFERNIWDDFWNIANDPQRARQLGIRAAHGDAVSIKVQEGKTYRILLRASDGLSITPEEDAPAPVDSREAT